MYEPSAPSNAPEACFKSYWALQFSDAHLRLYGHPELLRVAASINGEDFVPFNEAIWIKHPHLGGSVAWHQDGTTQWDHPDFDEGRMASILWRNSMAAMPLMGYGLSQGRTTHALTYRDFMKTLDQTD